MASAEVLQGYRLRVAFLDGTTGLVDMRRLVTAQDGGVFAALADPDLFAQARVEIGAVTWPGGQDLAPDAMYRAVASTGAWAP